jgi:hypothetical protein
MPTISLTDDELAAVAAAIRRLVDEDRFPNAPRLDPLKAALGKFDSALPPSRRSRRQRPEAISERGDNRTRR